jgi:hypothetical protein
VQSTETLMDDKKRMSASVNSKIKASKGQRLFGQYYTCNEVSRLLVERIDCQSAVRSVIDLCVGQGALLHAARERYPNAQLYGYDIDPVNIKSINQCADSYINAYHVDTTSENLIAQLPTNTFDIVLGNPPFGTTPKSLFITSLLKDFGWDWSSTVIPLEVLYLVLGLRLTKPGGVLSYIVPDGIITNDKFSRFRKVLIENYNVKKVTYLGSDRFYGTEARTHLITIENTKPHRNCEIIVDSIIECTKLVSISTEQFKERGDYVFHTIPAYISAIPLKNFDVDIFRGREAHKNHYESKREVIHTTSFKSEYREFSNSANSIDGKGTVIKGDILIARVGSRIIGRVGFIKKGCFAISDCIIAIRAHNKFDRAAILQVLKSPYGKNWLESVSKGVGAKHITMKSIKELPIHHEF